ncbi:hypothetical protein [Pseudoalteromonas sp. BSi20495]|uniref:hypothetical protein n=1 Tax=Pseudoalteromonas sp. BSi20495 TaxID=386429 RepID=UPI000518939D|nr:hypothetical protein [Pseudoalteromonas sp. BSi20495]
MMDLSKLKQEVTDGVTVIFKGETLSKSFLEKTINALVEQIIESYDQEKSKVFESIVNESKTIQQLDAEVSALETMIAEEDKLLNKMGG